MPLPLSPLSPPGCLFGTKPQSLVAYRCRELGQLYFFLTDDGVDYISVISPVVHAKLIGPKNLKLSTEKSHFFTGESF